MAFMPIFTLAADIKNVNQLFVSICIEESSVGFSWENKKWVEKRFNADKIMIKKLASANYKQPKKKTHFFMAAQSQKPDMK